MSILNTILIAVVAYTALVLVLRLAGKRVLSKWNAFDLVITVALGSSLATTIVSAQTPLTQGIAAFATLALLQFVAARLSVTSKLFESAIKSTPRLIFLKGNFLLQAMKRERVTKREVRAAIRARGIDSVDSVDAVVLETDGSFSVIENLSRNPSALADIEGFKEVESVGSN